MSQWLPYSMENSAGNRQKRNLTRTQFSLTKIFKKIQGKIYFMVLGYFLLLLGSDKYSCSFLLLKSPQLQGWRFFFF